MARKLKRVDGGVAAHESVHRVFDRCRKLAALQYFEIEAGGGEAGATGDQKMCNVVAFGVEL